MKIKTFMVSLITCLLLAAGFNASAEREKYIVFEALPLKIKLAKDGTGIVRDVKCKGCDFSVVKITENTRATQKGIEVDILEARKRAGKSAMVSFNPKTQEVLYIRWY